VRYDKELNMILISVRELAELASRGSSLGATGDTPTSEEGRALHKQLAAAWKKRKNGEILPDEDLPVKKQNRWLSMICLIFAYLAMTILWGIFCYSIVARFI
jgi:hypothetical protein